MTEIELVFEREANQGSAELLFQVDLMKRIAKDYPTDVSTPVQLAAMFGASMHSTFRRWIEDHRGQVCGIVVDPVPTSVSPPTFRRFEVVTSLAWRTHLASTASRRPVGDDVSSRSVGSAPRSPRSISVDWRMADLGGTAHGCVSSRSRTPTARSCLSGCPGKKASSPGTVLARKSCSPRRADCSPSQSRLLQTFIERHRRVSFRSSESPPSQPSTVTLAQLIREKDDRVRIGTAATCLRLCHRSAS